MRTKHYKIMSDLYQIGNEENARTKIKKYYIFNYNCGNTKIQSITGYIRCFKTYSLYKENNNNLKKKLIEKYNLQVETVDKNCLKNKTAISVLLCVNVSNCLSPSDFLELLYPFDNFIFFLKVLNKKNNEEYMIYFLTFNKYAKKIMKTAKCISYFNMKKKKRLKIYIVKDITMNVTSCISKKNKRLISTHKYYEKKKEKFAKSNVKNGATQRPFLKTNFINALYLISQNKFQLSCAVCLEPLYSESLSKIISYIFNLNLENQKKKIIRKKDPFKNQCSNKNDMTIKNNINGNYNKEEEKKKKIKDRYDDNVVGGMKNELVKKENFNKTSITTTVPNGGFYEEYTSIDKCVTNKENNSIFKREQYYLPKTLNSYTMNGYTHDPIIIRFVNNMQNKYKNQIKKKKKNNKNQIFNNVCINILCSHIFHSNCLKKCCFTSCPICRYKQYNYKIANCDICEKNYDVKICLFCGFIGCSVNYDKINKLKNKKLKEKKKLLKKKSGIIRKIILTFLRIVNFFPEKDSFISVPSYYNRKNAHYKVANISMDGEEKGGENCCIYNVKNVVDEQNEKHYEGEILLNKNEINGKRAERQNEHNYYINQEEVNLSEKKEVNETCSCRDKVQWCDNARFKKKNIRNDISISLLGSNENNECSPHLKNFLKYIYIRAKVQCLGRNRVTDKVREKKEKERKKKEKRGGNKNKSGENKRNDGKAYIRKKCELTQNRRKKIPKKRKKGFASFNKYDVVIKVNNRYDGKNYPKKINKKIFVDHAKGHFYETNHNYFFDISKNSVYDYSSHLYIKKLINLKSENKELKKVYSGNIYMNGKDGIIDKKNIIMYIYEFNQLLSALLESQRDNFLSCIYELKLNYENIDNENLIEISKCFNEINNLQQANYNLKTQVRKKMNIYLEKLKTNEELRKQLKNVEIINEKLCENQKKEIHKYEVKTQEKKKIIKEKQQIIRELNQQITDLRFHKQATAKFCENAEIKNSSFMIGEKITQKSRFKKR
ncbi:zinc finger protein [Plasmodium brasilianum]|uniref:Zinc finger protein n=1 Tax=Plasmodium brasilianum TaxID=5824 RepID=A0ACB9Y9E9_PLABR|nr:zinc finger protein [Plasmodium brasilianum]